MDEKKITGFWSGLLYGLLPHSFCIAFIVLTVIGATALTGLVRSLFLIPYFFQFLVGLSLVLATISAFIYLRRNGLCSFGGAKRKWRYLAVLYGTTLSVNLLMFMVILPKVANIGSMNQASILSQQANTASVMLAVDIPCSGHAPLIIDELGKVEGINWVEFKFPNLFEVNYDSRRISLEQLLTLEIFKTYKAKIIQ